MTSDAVHPTRCRSGCVFSFGGSPTSQDAPTPVQPAADEVVEIKVEAPAPEPAVEVKKEEPQPAPAKACCVVC